MVLDLAVIVRVKEQLVFKLKLTDLATLTTRFAARF